MALRVRSTPTFDRAQKKLHPRDQKVIDAAVRAILANPGIGSVKKGDLAGVCVHKFRLNKQELLLSYRLLPRELVLLSLGSHENFYRDLKR